MTPTSPTSWPEQPRQHSRRGDERELVPADGAGRIDTRGRITEIALPTPDNVPQALVFDRLGRLWYTASEANKLGRIDRNGTITEFDVPTPHRPATWHDPRPGQRALVHRAIGRTDRHFDLARETFTEYTLPTGANPQRIVLGHDGALWFTEFSPSRIGQITPDGALTEYPAPSQPVGIVADPHGLWYAGFNPARIGQLSYAGVPTVEYQVPTPNSRPIQLTLTHGRNPDLWFTENGANRIGRLQLSR